MSPKWSRLLCLAAWLVGLSLLVAGASWQTGNKQQLIVVSAASISESDPGQESNLANQRLLSCLYETLVRPGPQVGTVAPGLAHTWQHTRDLCRWRFTIRPGITFHDGSELTAETVALSMRRFYDPALTPSSSSRSQYRAFAAFFGSERRLLRGVRPLNKYTVEFHLARPLASFPEILAHPSMAIVAPSVVSGRNQGRPLGTGPYQFVESRPGQRFRLRAFAHYWGKQPAIRDLIFICVPSAWARERELLRGNADAALGMNPQHISSLGKQHGKKYAYFSNPGLSSCTLLINCAQRPFTDIRCRLGVYYALPLEALWRKYSDSRGEVARSLLSPQSWAYLPAFAGGVGDQRKARNLFQRALGAEQPQVVLLCSRTSTSIDNPTRLAADIARALQDSGLSVKIRTEDSVEFTRLLRAGAYGLALVSQEEPTSDPDVTLSLGWSRVATDDGFANLARFFSDHLQENIDRAKTSQSPDDRLISYHQVQEQLAESMAAVPLFWHAQNNACVADVNGLTVDRFGAINFADLTRR